MRSSVIVAIVMLLKAHLKTLYGLSEEYVALKLTRATILTDAASQQMREVRNWQEEQRGRPSGRAQARTTACMGLSALRDCPDDDQRRRRGADHQGTFRPVQLFNAYVDRRL